jgi:hypothetical protein
VLNFTFTLIITANSKKQTALLFSHQNLHLVLMLGTVVTFVAFHLPMRRSGTAVIVIAEF